jgi:hypothetical protein
MKRTLLLASALLLLARPLSAATIAVKAGESVQAAIDRAQPGDEIVLQAGARFVGALKLPAKAFGLPITIRSSATLPERRIGPADAPLLPVLAASGEAAVSAVNTASWRLSGLKLEPTFPYGEIISCNGVNSIEFDRLLIEVAGTQQQKRAIGCNGKAIKLTRSYCGNIWVTGQDSQCFAAWDGAGPYTIVDNYLAAASENVLFGGADSSAPENLPSDILVEGNTFTKPLEWKPAAGQFSGKNIKNLFELKAARRAIIRNNLFENNFNDAQSGYAILFTPRNQGGRAPWTQVSDVLFERNIVRNSPSMFQVMGYDSKERLADGTIVARTTLQTTGILIRHNLFLGAGGGRLVNITNENGSVAFDHNTYIQPQGLGSAPLIGVYAEGDVATPEGLHPAAFAAEKLTVTNNAFQYNTYGVHSSGAAQGTASLNSMAKAWEWKQNVLGGGGGAYPAGTFFVTAALYPGLFTPAPDYLLKEGSPYAKLGTDGLDIGWAGQAAPPVTKPPTTPSGLAVQVSAGDQKCRVTLSAEPPDTSGGWQAATVVSGSELRIVWSKAGQANVEVVAGVCK